MTPAERWIVNDVFAREYRMVHTNWGPEPFEPVAVELEPVSGHGWPEPGEALVLAARAERAEAALRKITRLRGWPAEEARRIARAALSPSSEH